MLQHPSLVSMIGVALRPWVLVLELAPMGSLGTLLKKGFALNRLMQHRIAIQVFEALQFIAWCLQHVLIYMLLSAVPLNMTCIHVPVHIL